MSYIYQGKILNIFDKHIEVYIPPIIWLILLLYLFFPYKKIFNFKGRMYFFKLCKDVLLSPFYPVKFLIPWAADQVLSLVIPLRDLGYVFCYCYSTLQTGSMDNNCYNYPYARTELFIIFLPSVYRWIHCMKKARVTSGWERKMQITKARKYFKTIITTFLRFFQ